MGDYLRRAYDEADRIDAEHERACAEAWDNGYESDYLGVEKWLTEHPQVMEHHGWIRLPLDADGEVIHFGDVLDQFGTPMTVFAMSDPDPDQGDCMLELITDGISDSTWVRARKMRHHHEPTVEDVLREENENLRAENAKLREELEAAKHDLSLFSGELVASKLECAKLRELGLEVDE